MFHVEHESKMLKYNINTIKIANKYYNSSYLTYVSRETLII